MWSATTGRVASITGRERSDSTVISSLARRRHDVRRSSPPRTGRLHPAKRSPGPPPQVPLPGRGGSLVGDRSAGEHAERHRGTGTLEAGMDRTQEPGGDYGYDEAHQDVQRSA